MKYVFPFIALAVLLFSCQPKTDKTDKSQPHTPVIIGAKTPLTKTYIDPGPGYSQAVVVEANGIKTIHISGQVGTGPNFESQLNEALEGLLKTLEHSGASFEDVVKYNTYVVDYQPSYLDSFRTVRKQLLGDKDMPASTLVGVEALGKPEWKVEIDAIAVVEGRE
ncbi:RidA family protein [Maribacter flavus]|nr:RidA family protein [Maribacter flavus]